MNEMGFYYDEYFMLKYDALVKETCSLTLVYKYRPSFSLILRFFS